jgi:hypothetical protein
LLHYRPINFARKDRVAVFPSRCTLRLAEFGQGQISGENDLAAQAGVAHEGVNEAFANFRWQRAMRREVCDFGRRGGAGSDNCARGCAGKIAGRRSFRAPPRFAAARGRIINSDQAMQRRRQ